MKLEVSTLKEWDALLFYSKKYQDFNWQLKNCNFHHKSNGNYQGFHVFVEKLQDLSASNQIDKLQGQIIKNVVFQGWSSYLIQWLNCNQTILKHSRLFRARLFYWKWVLFWYCFHLLWTKYLTSWRKKCVRLWQIISLEKSK